MIEKAIFGGGCFWCIETIFGRINGVQSSISGYIGGIVENPTYEEVCTGSTEHVEVVEVTYDATIISFTDLLKVFFKIHNPTQLNHQGEDIGTQYRSVIFYTNETQKEISISAIANLETERIWQDPIVTAVEPAVVFYPAETYHQDYFNQNKSKNPYCSLVVAPKVEKFEKAFGGLMK
jgi:peptide-methionine (S)-S-oxide reductase